MMLEKKPGSPVRTNTRERLPILEQNPAVTVSEVKAVNVPGGGDESFIKISGFAAEPGGGKAGGVAIFAGGKLYPAVYGFLGATFRKTDAGPYETYFVRTIPAAEIRANQQNSFFLFVRSADGRWYYRPSGYRVDASR